MASGVSTEMDGGAMDGVIQDGADDEPDWLREAAADPSPARTVAVRRRTLLAALPGEAGSTSQLLLEQSDLEAVGRMWRSMCVRGSSPDQVHRFVLSLREHLVASGLTASTQRRTRLRTRLLRRC